MLVYYLFVMVCVLHLVSIAFEKDFLRFKTKVLIMPMLLLIYILNANSFSIVFLMAMIFGWLKQDVYGKKSFCERLL